MLEKYRSLSTRQPRRQQQTRLQEQPRVNWAGLLEPRPAQGESTQQQKRKQLVLQQLSSQQAALVLLTPVTMVQVSPLRRHAH
jgi:hypothetical protein